MYHYHRRSAVGFVCVLQKKEVKKKSVVVSLATIWCVSGRVGHYRTELLFMPGVGKSKTHSRFNGPWNVLSMRANELSLSLTGTTIHRVWTFFRLNLKKSLIILSQILIEILFSSSCFILKSTCITLKAEREKSGMELIDRLNGRLIRRVGCLPHATMISARQNNVRIFGKRCL